MHISQLEAVNCVGETCTFVYLADKDKMMEIKCDNMATYIGDVYYYVLNICCTA